MPKTINALIEDEIGGFPVNTQQRLADAGIYREAISALSQSAEEGSITLLAKNDNSGEKPDI